MMMMMVFLCPSDGAQSDTRLQTGRLLLGIDDWT